MYAAVLEERPLWELPAGAIDLLPDGPVRHGPWEPRACAELIIRWLDRGWVELYLPDVPAQWDLEPAAWQVRAERRGAFSVLGRADARQLLQDWHRWTLGSADGQVSLSRTDVGMSIPVNDWVNLHAVGGLGVRPASHQHGRIVPGPGCRRFLPVATRSLSGLRPARRAGRRPRCSPSAGPQVAGTFHARLAS